MTDAKAHHYIPAFHLAYFTPSGRREDFLRVTFTSSGKNVRVRPDATGFENYYYRMPEPPPGKDPNFFEDLLQQVEGLAARVVRNLIETERMPTRGEDYAALINYLSLLASRGPGARAKFERIGDFPIHAQLTLEASRRQAAGDEKDRAFVRMVRERSYRLEWPPERSIYDTVLMNDVILQGLAKREWCDHGPAYGPMLRDFG